MIRFAMTLSLLLGTLAFVPNVYAKGGVGGGGSAQSETTIKYIGYVTKMQPAPGGVLLTVGTSYYAVGTALVTPSTKIKLNGSSSVSIGELRVGDYAEIKVSWPSRIAIAIEAIGVR